MSADNPQYILNWNNYTSDVKEAFDSLLKAKEFVDVTLSCEGNKIRAHKMLLSACSTYFHDLFRNNPCEHAVVIFSDVKFEDLEHLLTFMYTGEVSVPTEHLDSFLKTAELLHVSGLPGNRSRPINAENDHEEAHDEAELSQHIRSLLKRHAQTAQERAETSIDGRNDNSNATEENPSKRLELKVNSTINTEIKQEQVEVLNPEPEELPLDDNSNTSEENPTIITEIKQEQVEGFRTEPEELPLDDNYNTSEENPTIITEIEYEQVEVLKMELEELPSDDNYNTSEENPTITTQIEYEQVEVWKTEPEELPSDDNSNTLEENPTIITEITYKQVKVLNTEPVELSSDDNSNTSEENPTIITEIIVEQVELLTTEPEELLLDDSLLTDTEEEIDVVSVGEKQNVGYKGTYSLPTNPSSRGRQQLQHTMISAINGKQITHGIKTLSPIRKSSSRKQTPIKKRTSEARAKKRSRHYRYKRRITCAQSSDSDTEPLERRSLHNTMERQRRIDLAKLFFDLRMLVPAVRSRAKASKILILKEAGFYCDHLENTSVHLNKHLKELQKQQRRLRARLSKLRTNFVANY